MSKSQIPKIINGKTSQAKTNRTTFRVSSSYCFLFEPWAREAATLRATARKESVVSQSPLNMHVISMIKILVSFLSLCCANHEAGLAWSAIREEGKEKTLQDIHASFEGHFTISISIVDRVTVRAKHRYCSYQALAAGRLAPHPPIHNMGPSKPKLLMGSCRQVSIHWGLAAKWWACSCWRYEASQSMMQHRNYRYLCMRLR